MAVTHFLWIGQKKSKHSVGPTSPQKVSEVRNGTQELSNIMTPEKGETGKKRGKNKTTKKYKPHKQPMNYFLDLGSTRGVFFFSEPGGAGRCSGTWPGRPPRRPRRRGGPAARRGARCTPPVGGSHWSEGILPKSPSCCFLFPVTVAIGCLGESSWKKAIAAGHPDPNKYAEKARGTILPFAVEMNTLCYCPLLVLKGINFTTGRVVLADPPFQVKRKPEGPLKTKALKA